MTTASGKVPRMHVLVIEDEHELNGTIVAYLNLSGFAASGVPSQAAAVAWLATHPCDMVVLDLGLPDGDGLSLARELASAERCGIVMMTARGQVEDRLEGYRAGAVQYLVKPVDLRELVAVLAAAGRQRPGTGDPPWTLDGLGWRLTTPGGRSVSLTRSELAVLEALADRPGQAVGRAVIFERLGIPPDRHDPRRMEILIRRLRRKVEAETGVAVPIETVHAVGYAFTARIRRQ
ncbi:transcriptional regulator [Allostella vacuolata]|nr:transcriptional regulator [Stella vacuolata]